LGVDVELCQQLLGLISSAGALCRRPDTGLVEQTLGVLVEQDPETVNTQRGPEGEIDQI
jgi:hypothetical protein